MLKTQICVTLPQCVNSVKHKPSSKPCRLEHSVSVIKTGQTVLYRDILVVCSEMQTKHLKTLCGQKVLIFRNNLEALVVNSKDIGLEVNADKTKYMVMSRDQNAERSHSIKTYNSCIEIVEQFNYFGTAFRKQNSIQEETKSRLKSGNACYNSVQNLLSYSLLFKRIKTEIYRTIILPVVLYGCKTRPLTLREERRLRVFENRVLRTIFDPKRDEVTGEWRKLHNEKLNNLYSSPNIVRVTKSRRMRWVWHVARMGEKRRIQGFGGET